MPMAPLVDIKAVELALSYPAFTMAGMIIIPSAATVAGPEPEIAAKKQATITHTRAIPLFLCPTNDLQKSISLWEIPLFSMIFPPRIKKGIARSTNLLVAEYILIVTIETGRFSYNKVRILEIPSKSPMGTFSKSRTKNAPNSIRPAISSSPPSLLDRG